MVRVIVTRNLDLLQCCFNTNTPAMVNRGYGWRGCLGHDNEDNQLRPKKVEALADEVIVEVICEYCYTCAFASTGSMYEWGRSLTNGHEWPSDVISLSTCGHTACVSRVGEVLTWVNVPNWGQEIGASSLGHGIHKRTSQQLRTPTRVEALVGVVKVKMVACGLSHTAFCTESGHVYTFGSNGVCLGHGDRENRSSPTLVQALEGRYITQVQCGFNRTMVLTSSGYVLTWGCGRGGQLGHGTCCDYSIPCVVKGLYQHNVVQITCCDSHSAVLIDPSPSLIRQFQQATFNNKDQYDVVFMVENQPLYANVEILSQKSDYFATMFRCQMRESIEKVVKVPNCTKKVFLGVLRYLCFDDFSVDINDVVELWVLADLYQLEGLKYCCMGGLERGLKRERAHQVLIELEGLDCECNGLRRKCIEYLELFRKVNFSGS